jgi:Nitroreductase
MGFLDIAKARFSVRNYKPVEIEDNKLSMMLEAFRVAPSAVNFQPWHIILIKTDPGKLKVHEAYPREWLKTAPVILIVCGDHRLSWKRSDNKDHLDIDVSIAIDHLMLQATELGLGTCWVCNFNTSTIRKNFNLPEHIEPIAIIPVGYPTDSPDVNRHESKRKPIDAFLHHETF